MQFKSLFASSIYFCHVQLFLDLAYSQYGFNSGFREATNIVPKLGDFPTHAANGGGQDGTGTQLLLRKAKF